MHFAQPAVLFVGTYVPAVRCSGTQTLNQSGALIATNPGDAVYANNANCTWIISAPPGYQPCVAFTDFRSAELAIRSPPLVQRSLWAFSLSQSAIRDVVSISLLFNHRTVWNPTMTLSLSTMGLQLLLPSFTSLGESSCDVCLCSACLQLLVHHRTC